MMIIWMPEEIAFWNTGTMPTLSSSVTITSGLARISSATGRSTRRSCTGVLDAFGVHYLGGPESLDTLLVQSDYVSVHVPLTRRTRHLLDGRALAVVRPRGV